MPDRADEILIRSKNGDLAAFRQLVETHYAYVYSLAFRMLCDHEDAKDAVQESFLRVWRHLPAFDINKKFTTWLYKIVTNICLDHLKARKRRRALFTSDMGAGTHVRDGKDMAADHADRDLAQRIARLAESLPPKQRVVFVLRDLQDFELDEVVQITGFSKKNIKSHLYYARLNIRQKLRDLE